MNAKLAKKLRRKALNIGSDTVPGVEYRRDPRTGQRIHSMNSLAGLYKHLKRKYGSKQS